MGWYKRDEGTPVCAYCQRVRHRPGTACRVRDADERALAKERAKERAVERVMDHLTPPPPRKP